MEVKYSLGEELKDIVTGCTGVVIARIEYLTGCIHYGLQAKMNKDGKIPDPEYFDESRLISVGTKLKKYKVPNTSGPEKAPSGRW